MDKNAIKKFAIAARRDLIERVCQRAERFGISEDKPIDEQAVAFHGQVMTQEQADQRRKLIIKIREDGYKQVMEEAAYIWFNRFIALRFMEVNRYLPSHVRVFSDRNNAFDPEILTEALHLEIDGLVMEKVFALEEANKKEELFKYLLIVQCKDLGRRLPVLFEEISDYTELLFPDNLLREGSVIEQMVTTIPEDDWKDAVQIIGWLYQYYNTEPKDQVFANLKKNIKIGKNDIPAATQLFTPDWIVRYMVENSLGRLWIDHLRAVEESGTLDLSARNAEAEMLEDGVLNIKSIGDFAIKGNWKYYLDEAPQEPEVEAQLKEIRAQYAQLDPAQILCCDPCMGSGHILVYMFDVLVQIYLSYGYTTNEAVESIVRNNLWGLDIDKRAAQLAYFAVMMKAQQYDSCWLDKQLNHPVTPNVFELQDSGKWEDFEPQMRRAFANHQSLLETPCVETARALFECFADAKEYGSIIQPNIDLDALKLLENTLDDLVRASDLLDVAAQADAVTLSGRLRPMILRCRALVQTYDIVITNPPYLSSGNMSTKLSDFVKDYYPDSKSDLCTCFIDRIFMLLSSCGFSSMITMESWMSLSSFKELRQMIIGQKTIIDLLHMPYLGKGGTSLGINFGTAATIIRNSHVHDYASSFFRSTYLNCDEEGIPFNFPIRDTYYNITKASNFTAISGSPVSSYYATKAIFDCFSRGKNISEIAIPASGTSTGDNDRFLRLWNEVPFENINLHARNGENAPLRWFPCNKGGAFRRWAGGSEYIVDWENNGERIKACPKAFLRNVGSVFKEGLTWSKLGSGTFSIRFFSEGYICESIGCCLFYEKEDLRLLLGLLNSVVGAKLLSIINPSMGRQPGYIGAVPYIMQDSSRERVIVLVDQCINISTNDWDSFETSWNFQMHPIVKAHFDNQRYAQEGLLKGRNPNTIRDCFIQWGTDCELRFAKLKANEEELNRIFIEIYGLQDELTPDVEDKDVTVRKANLGRDIRSLISYAVGCMFGRYNLDVPGLVFAGGSFDRKYCRWIRQFGDEADKHIDKDGHLDDGWAGCSQWEYDGIRKDGHWVKTIYAPDTDGILPITDDEYFTDDIVTMFVNWVETVFGRETLEENLKFIADALGGRGSSREVIRQYFLNDFYKDHLKVYQKRPIYWLFDSGKKNGFKCLIYMHRYQPDTLARIRTDYVHELQGRYRNAIDTLERQIAGASTSERVKLQKRQNTIKAQAEELRVYEEKIHHLADQMIKIDLDDGVKHNYTIFKDVLAPIK